jgi:hypothetical protein
LPTIGLEGCGSSTNSAVQVNGLPLSYLTRADKKGKVKTDKLTLYGSKQEATAAE